MPSSVALRTVLWMLAVMAAASMAGCGAGNSAAEGPGPSARPTQEFIIPGGDNTIQYFGREGSEAERAEASDVVQAWDRTRAGRDWQGDCRYLSRSYTQTVVLDARHTSKGKATNCVQALAFFGSVASGSSEPTTTGPIDSLRVSHGTGYAQYHGRNGVDWIVPLEKEHDRWKVAVTAPVDRRK